MGKTSIEWTERSANPIRARHKATGKVGWHCVMPSPGCANCYSHALNGRFGTGLPYNRRSEDEIELFLDMRPLEALRRLRRPSLVFLCDMTDLFGEFVPDEWIDRILGALAETPHAIQALTKRAGRARDYFATRECPANLWMGVSCEDQRRADERIPALLEIRAAVRFLSVEPLLGPIDLTPWLPHDEFGRTGERIQGDYEYRPIDWVIVGGESGPRARPCDLAWIRSIRDQCKAAGVPVFVKQLGTRPFDSEAANHIPGVDRLMTADEARRPENLELLGRTLEAMWVHLRDRKGGDPSEWPEDLRVREMPKARLA